MCHEISVAAFDAAGDPDRYPDAGEPWQPLKLYYSHGFSRARDGGVPRGAAGARAGVAVRGVAGELDDRPCPTPGARVTTRVQCADWFAGPRRGAAAHATQIDPTSRWFHRAARPAARGLADRGLRAGPLRWSTPTLPEDDLFAGHRGRAARDAPGELSGRRVDSWPTREEAAVLVDLGGSGGQPVRCARAGPGAAAREGRGVRQGVADRARRRRPARPRDDPARPVDDQAPPEGAGLVRRPRRQSGPRDAEPSDAPGRTAPSATPDERRRARDAPAAATAARPAA